MTSINVKEFNLSASMKEVRETIDALKGFKEMLLSDRIPYGEGNAKGASEIFGDDYAFLSNLWFNSQDYHYGNYAIIRRKEQTKKVTYVNPENPNDTITIKKKHYVYWREK